MKLWRLPRSKHRHFLLCILGWVFCEACVTETHVVGVVSNPGADAAADAQSVFIADSGSATVADTASPNPGDAASPDGAPVIIGAELAVDDFHPGSRLRPVVASVDGQRQLLNWFDSLLGVECAFALAEDGVTRCLPTEVGEDPDGNTPSTINYYSDQNCTVPVHPLATACLPKYVVEYQKTPCGTAQSVHQLGAASGSDVYGLYVRNDSGSCDSSYFLSDPLSPNDIALFSRGPVVPPETFVRATLAEQARGTRLRARFLVATDGAQQLVGLLDSTYNDICEVNGTQCLPAQVGAANGLFADPLCQQPVAEVSPGNIASACDSTSAILTGMNGMDLGYFESGQSISVGNLFEKSSAENSNGCIASHTDPTADVSSDQYYTFGNLLPLSSFPTIATSLEGVGRVKLSRAFSTTGEPLTPGPTHAQRDWGDYVDPVQFFDTKLQALCVPKVTSDGQMRCVPADDVADRQSMFFSDAGCTQPMVVDVGGPPPSRPPFAYTGFTRIGRCSKAQFHAYVGGGDPISVVNPLYASPSSDSFANSSLPGCTITRAGINPIPGAPATLQFQVYAAKEVPATDYPLVEIATE